MDRQEFSEHLLNHAAKEKEVQQREQMMRQSVERVDVKEEAGVEDFGVPGLLPRALLGQVHKGEP